MSMFTPSPASRTLSEKPLTASPSIYPPLPTSQAGSPLSRSFPSKPGSSAVATRPPLATTHTTPKQPTQQLQQQPARSFSSHHQGSVVPISNAPLSVQKPPTAIVPAVAPAVTTPAPKEENAQYVTVNAETLRLANMKTSFRNLRFNLLFLVVKWWLESSKPYRLLRRGLRQQGYGNVDLALHYISYALTFLFLFNLLYSTYQLFFPSLQPTTRIPAQLYAVPSTSIPLPSSLLNPHNGTPSKPISGLAKRPSELVSPLVRSSPRTRPSPVATLAKTRALASPQSRDAAHGTPQQTKPAGAGTPGQTPGSQRRVVSTSGSGSPRGSPLAALKAQLLGPDGSTSSPGGSGSNRSTSGNSNVFGNLTREELLKEQAFLARQGSPGRAIYAL